MKTLAKVVTAVVVAGGSCIGLSMVADAYGPTVSGALLLAAVFFVGTAATGDL